MEQSNISLQYGIHRTPSLGNDGELSELVNLIPQNGELVNIQEPVDTDITLLQGEVLLYIHETSRFKHYIIKYEDVIYWRADGSDKTSLSVSSSCRKVISIGNTLIMLRDDGIRYFLWSESEYKDMGNKIPEVYMDFYLQDYSMYTERDGASPVFPNLFSKDVSSGGGRGSIDFTEELVTEIIGVINEFEENSKQAGFFNRPFYLIYGVKLYDESLTNLSSPILMTPSSATMPFAFYGYDNENLCRGFASFFRARLVYEVSLDNSFALYKDLIKSVCVFITPQYQTYDETATTIIGRNDIPADAIAIDNPSAKFRTAVGSSEYEDAFVNELDILEKWGNGGYRDKYLEFAPYSGDVMESIKKDFLDPSAFFLVEEIPFSELLEQNGDGRNYNVPSLYDKWNRIGRAGAIKIESSTDKLISLTALPNLNGFVIDGSSHRSRTAYDVFVYNNRISLAGVSWINSSERNDTQFFNRSEMDESAVDFLIKVKLVYDNTTFIQTIASGRLSREHNFAYFFYPDTHATEVLIYNSTDDTHTTLNLARSSVREGMYYCAGINNNGYINVRKANEEGRGDSSFWPVNELEDYFITSPEYSLLSTSKEGNPFVFPANANISLGTGEFRALSAPTEALSQGQFGDFIYAFCTDGIWGIRVNDEGAMHITQPVSRDVLTNKDSVTQIDNAVVFVTNQGLKLISGSDVTLLSTPVEGLNLDETFVKDAVDAFAEKVHGTSPYVQDNTQFIDQLQSADTQIVYDYAHNLLHIFYKQEQAEVQDIAEVAEEEQQEEEVQQEGEEQQEPAAVTDASPSVTTFYKHYVYNFDTKEWSTQVLAEPLTTAVPGYPLTTMQFGNSLYQYQKTTGDAMRIGYALTRPLALGNPLARKALYDLRVVGQRTNASTIRRVAVFVSNDNVHWHRLTSLKALSAKYYRFLIMTYMSDIDTISGLALQHELRYERKFRGH